MMRHIEVVPYRASWPLLFEKEARRLRGVWGDELIDIHHIGSTSVPGLWAKPVIDILPVVRRLERLELKQQEMQALGYQAMGEFGISGRRYFYREGDGYRTHHVHAFQRENPAITRHLAFRDYLRSYPEEARLYGEMKRELAKKFPSDIQGYMEGKHAWIQATEARALREYGKH